MKRVAFPLAAGAAIGVSTLIASPIPDATPISDDGASSLASVLAMPVSRASVAMLVEYPIEPSALTRLGEALRDPRPDVRAVAARVAFANRASVHVGVLSRALQAEQDPAAAIEELRALALFGNITTDQIALDVSRKMGASARLDFLIAFARSRPADFGSHIDALFTPEADTVTLLAPLAATLPESAPWLTPLFERAAGKLTWWNELLDGLDTQHARFAEAIGLGLRSQDERIRAATLWHVADVLASGRTLPDDLAQQVDAHAQRVVAASATASTAATAAAPRAAGSTGPAESASAEAFASDIFGRVRKRNRLRDWREPLRDYETWLGEDCRRRVGSLQPFFTAAEFAALYKDAWRPSPQEPSPDRSEPHPYLKKLKVMGPLRRTRTLPAFNTALLQDLMPATGCKPPGTRTGVGAVLTYRPDGRLAHIKLASERLSPACTKAVTVATLLTAIDPALPRPPEAVDIVYPLVSDNILTCAAAAIGEVPVQIDDDDQAFKRPVAKREVRPEFPQGALRQGIEGSVVTRAMVTTRGCVSEVEVVDGLHPDLDQEALNTVTRWQFEPARRDERPVATRVMIEVSFRIRKRPL